MPVKAIHEAFCNRVFVTACIDEAHRVSVDIRQIFTRLTESRTNLVIHAVIKRREPQWVEQGDRVEDFAGCAVAERRLVHQPKRLHDLGKAALPRRWGGNRRPWVQCRRDHSGYSSTNAGSAAGTGCNVTNCPAIFSHAPV